VRYCSISLREVKMVNEYNLQLGNIYNIDETGFAIRSTQAACVLIDASIRIQF